MARTRTLTVTGGTTTVPVDATAVIVNVTVTNASATSHLTVSPAGEAIPNASNLSFAAGQTVPNLVAVKIGTNDQISVYNNTGTTPLIADIIGDRT